MKVRPLGAKLFQVDGRTDYKANSRFSKFCELA
jgi:hypothetical protein